MRRSKSKWRLPPVRRTWKRWFTRGKRSSPAAFCAFAASTARRRMPAPSHISSIPSPSHGEGQGGGLDESLIHVLRRLELIEARVRAAVARRRATDPETDDRFRGLYISQGHVDRLLAEKSVPAAPDAGAAKARDEIEAAAAAAAPASDSGWSCAVCRRAAPTRGAASRRALPWWTSTWCRSKKTNDRC